MGDSTERSVEIHGTCDPRFERVRAAFAANFENTSELGASVAIAIDNVLVVDLWAGAADKAGRAWERDTLANVFSTTKGFTAICAHRLVDQGKLDLDAPLAQLWPEFGAAGKDRITVRSLLGHRGGLPAVRETLPPEALYDWSAMTHALAAEAPWWEPDTAHGYHAVTFGWLVGEAIRRASGKMPGVYFRDEIAKPLGLDAHIGLDARDDVRCAELRSVRREPGQTTLFDRMMADPMCMTARAFTNPISLVLPFAVATREWRGADLPSVNGHATARAIAKLYGALAAGGVVDGVRVLSPESIARCGEEHSAGLDLVLDVETRFGGGFMLPQPHSGIGRGRSFGHPGLGGSIGFADVDRRIGFGYVMNRLGAHILVDPRADALIHAMYESL